MARDTKAWRKREIRQKKERRSSADDRVLPCVMQVAVKGRGQKEESEKKSRIFELEKKE